ncbi:MAG: hypothetical protein HND50_07550 [Calditrichaeota bacterium]|nr:hypothetical protein [Calditrichota bacterium]
MKLKMKVKIKYKAFMYVPVTQKETIKVIKPQKIIQDLKPAFIFPQLAQA